MSTAGDAGLLPFAAATVPATAARGKARSATGGRHGHPGPRPDNPYGTTMPGPACPGSSRLPARRDEAPSTTGHVTHITQPPRHDHAPPTPSVGRPYAAARPVETARRPPRLLGSRCSAHTDAPPGRPDVDKAIPETGTPQHHRSARKTSHTLRRSQPPADSEAHHSSHQQHSAETKCTEHPPHSTRAPPQSHPPPQRPPHRDMWPRLTGTTPRTSHAARELAQPAAQPAP